MYLFFSLDFRDLKLQAAKVTEPQRATSPSEEGQDTHTLPPLAEAGRQKRLEAEAGRLSCKQVERNQLECQQIPVGQVWGRISL